MSTLTYTKLPNPMREGDLLYHETDAFLNALEDAGHGAPLRRSALGAEAPPEEAEVRGLEGRLRRAAASRSRGAPGPSGGSCSGRRSRCCGSTSPRRSPCCSPGFRP